MVRPLHIKNANIQTGNKFEKRDLYCSDIILDKPAPDSLVVDLEGYRISPGLINAHDHLELNHYPRTKFREVYNNAHEWGEDVNARLDTEPYKSLRQYPIWDRLFIGGLKNLLCGATTVAHHGPKYREMYRKDFPVRVIKDYGWSHSLHFDTEEDIIKSYQSTPKDHPWFIHLAEGTDDVAKSEYGKLKEMGCVGENTVIVHGVGLTKEDVMDASNIVKGLIWCPTTNLYLLNARNEYLIYWRGEFPPSDISNIAIGSDSRLTADGDLVSESRLARGSGGCDVSCIEQAISIRPAKILGRDDLANLNIDSQADLIIGSKTTYRNRGGGSTHRNIIGAIITKGIPQIGDPDIMAKFPHIETVSALLDGVPKSINISLARQIQKCKLKEQGLELMQIPRKKFWIF